MLKKEKAPTGQKGLSHTGKNCISTNAGIDCNPLQQTVKQLILFAFYPVALYHLSLVTRSAK